MGDTEQNKAQTEGIKVGSRVMFRLESDRIKLHSFGGTVIRILTDFAYVQWDCYNEPESCRINKLCIIPGNPLPVEHNSAKEERHPKPFGTTSDRDWQEDFEHENGNYTNTCVECKNQFWGHKRRVICKKCAEPDWAELANRKPPEDTKDNKAWAGAWLEGEMVGYAKCMVEKVIPKLSPTELESQEALLSELEKFIYVDTNGHKFLGKGSLNQFIITRRTK